jgi:hypothetical protein
VNFTRRRPAAFAGAISFSRNHAPQCTAGAAACFCAPAEASAKRSTLSEISRSLIAIDRYERRALSRRKFAVRDFDAALRQSAE